MDPHSLTVVCDSFDARTIPPLNVVSRYSRARMHLGFGKILIVDDNDIDQLRATVLSNELGATVEVVSSGRHALATLEASSDVRLVLMDCDMPDMNGLEATRQWRRLERGWRSAIPIVGLSRSGATDYLRCLAAGMNDCLSKPLRREDVERCFTRWAKTALPTDTYPARSIFYEE